MTNLHVLLTLLLLQLVGPLLNLMSLLVVLLLRQVCLNLSLVKELGRLFECERERLLKHGPILLQLLSVQDLKLLELLLVLLLRLGENGVPMLIELLVLLDMRLLDFLLALLMSEHKLLILHVEFLLLQLKNTVLRHLGLCK